MAMESDLAIAARDVLPPMAPSQSGGNAQEQALATAAAATVAAAAAASAADEGVTLSLSAQGRLMAAFADAVDSVTAPVTPAATSNTQVQSSNATLPLAGQPVTRATLFAIEARLVAARSGADAIAHADSEVPASSDPQRLQQSRQATESLYGRAANPFAGLSRAELSAIVYDESGAYTVNERYAAANQRTAVDQQFWTPVFQQALESGNWQPVITAALAFYATLSPLEQTAYPANYVQLLQQYLDLYQWQPQSPLPPQQQLDLARMLETLVLPTGPLVLAGGVIRGLVLPRSGPSLAELIAAAPRLADLIQIDNIAHSVQDTSYLVLLQRVFGVGRREDEPAVARRAAPGVGNSDFLSAADRRYLAQAYGFARLHGMALEDVDALARDLARYRRQRAEGGNAGGGAGGRESGIGGNDGKLAATAGAALASATARMGSDDMSTARSLLNSAAAHATTLDHAFLAWLLDPVNAVGEQGQEGRAVSLSALEKLLAGLAGLRIGDPQADASEPESVYRLTLERIALQDMAADATRTRASSDAPTLTLAAQMAAQARSDVAEEAFMNNALMLLRMYRLSLKMSDTEQRTLAELVYSQLKKRRARPRRGKLFLAWATRSPWMPSLAA